MTEQTEELNEIAAAARDAKRVREAAGEGSVYNRESWPVVPIAIGVGSAAVAAAFLFVNRSRKK